MFGAANTVTAVTLTYEPGSNSLTPFVGAYTDVGLHCCLRASTGTFTIRGEKNKLSAGRNYGELVRCLMSTRIFGMLGQVTTTAPFH